MAIRPPGDAPARAVQPSAPPAQQQQQISELSLAPSAHVEFRASRSSNNRSKQAYPAVRPSVLHGSDPFSGHLSPEPRSEKHTSELQSLMRISYAVFCLKKTKNHINTKNNTKHTHIKT